MALRQNVPHSGWDFNPVEQRRDVEVCSTSWHLSPASAREHSLVHQCPQSHGQRVAGSKTLPGLKPQRVSAAPRWTNQRLIFFQGSGGSDGLIYDANHLVRVGLLHICALTDWSLRRDPGIPHNCCALCSAVYFGSTWTAANKRPRSRTAKASGRGSMATRRPSWELAGRKTNLTPSSCLTCETQNSPHSAASCLKTSKTNKAFGCRTQCLSLFPLPRKKKKNSVQETRQAKLRPGINHAVISEILHLVGENLPDALRGTAV